jgi:hypothetical protein
LETAEAKEKKKKEKKDKDKERERKICDKIKKKIFVIHVMYLC